MHKLKNLASLLLATCISSAYVNCSHTPRLNTTPQNETTIKTFFNYPNYFHPLDFKIKTDCDKKRLYVYPKNEKRPDKPLFECKGKQRIKAIIVGKVDFNNSDDIILLTGEYLFHDNSFHSPFWREFKHIDSWDIEKKLMRKKNLEYLSERNALVLFNQGKGKFREPVLLRYYLDNFSE